jgi:hypothetical protein
VSTPTAGVLAFVTGSVTVRSALRVVPQMVAAVREPTES